MDNESFLKDDQRFVRRFENISASDRVFYSLNSNLHLDTVFRLPSVLSDTIRTTKNWQDIVLFVLKMKRKIDVQFRNGKSLHGVTSYSQYSSHRNSIIRGMDYSSDLHTVEFPFRGKRISLKGDSELDFLYSAWEMYYLEVYKSLDCRNKVVVDVGANIGDSAIYFASKEAKHIYSFEPYPYSCRLADANIKRNRFERKITLVNAGVSGKKGKSS